MTRTLALSGDLPSYAVGISIGLASAGLLLIAWELFRHRTKAWAVAITGTLATGLLLAAVLRPVRVSSHGTLLGPRVTVLVDQSTSMTLPGDDGPRFRASAEAVRSLRSSSPNVRMDLLRFGEGEPSPWSVPDHDEPTTEGQSDLRTALTSVATSAEERSSAVVVISDGRLDLDVEGLRETLSRVDAPVHTVFATQHVPVDASIRRVHAAGAAVAHQPIRLTVTVGCDGGLECSDLPLVVRELADAEQPRILATGVAKMTEGTSTVELTITLDRAGSRVVEVAVAAPSGDEIPDNDRRFLTFDVTRDRVRILHIAGQPTYDVRALRQWLKADASLDVVAFFILRAFDSNVHASDDDLALIKFPVDELFTEHLSSFDAVVLQDFHAIEYRLAPYLSNLTRYVLNGGGLIMVGGLHAFSSGGYAGTPLERVLPVKLLPTSQKQLIDTSPFTPRITAAGRETPVLEGVRRLLGDRLPIMSGTNVLGEPREGTVILWEHPTRNTAGNRPMPVLALGEQGDGRALALSVDDTHKLAFSEVAAEHAGRAYGLLWDALVGWLMRDPRYEPARVDVVGGCRAGAPTKLRVHAVPGVPGEIGLELTKLGVVAEPIPVEVPPREGRSIIELEVPALDPGGYAARIRIGAGPSTRRDFACERGGDEWADSRPDPERLAAIARITQGNSVSWREVDALTFPDATRVSAERHVTPIVPPWVWTISAAIALGLHWIARRRFGLV